MSIIVTYKLIDTCELEKEFFALSAVAKWVTGIGQDMFEYITVTNEQGAVIEDMQTLFDMVALIEHKPHDLSQCGDACNCMKCNPSKSSCIAYRASELNIEVINHPMAPTPEQGDMSGLPVSVNTVTFGELEDGAEFYIAMIWAYGSRNKLQKVMEDGEHNAVWCSATHIGELIPDGIRVVRA